MLGAQQENYCCVCVLQAAAFKSRSYLALRMLPLQQLLPHHRHHR
jgi:hypothetical protein